VRTEQSKLRLSPPSLRGGSKERAKSKGSPEVALSLPYGIVFALSGEVTFDPVGGRVRKERTVATDVPTDANL